MARVPEAEVELGEADVRALVAAQHPDLAGLPLRPAGGGWDNAVWHLGEELAVRLPRRTLGAAAIVAEQRWLPEIAARVGVAVPAAVRTGVATDAFPWTWSIVPWFPGVAADTGNPGPHGARQLGSALHHLHVRAPADLPPSPYRGVPLAEREDPRPALDGLHDGSAPSALHRIWTRALAAEEAAPRSHPTWIHGDLHARNLVLSDGGELRAIIDWGDLGAGDPAVDLSVLWTVLEAGLHTSFCAGYGPLDGVLLARARGWALVFGVIFAGIEGDDGAAAIGRRTLQRLLG